MATWDQRGSSEAIWPMILARGTGRTKPMANEDHLKIGAEHKGPATTVPCARRKGGRSRPNFGRTPKLDFGRSGSVAEREGDAVAEPGAEFSHLRLSR